MLKEQLFIVTGNDYFARQECIKGIVAAKLSPEWIELNLEKFDGSQGISAILDGWLTPPFWGERRVLLAELQSEETNALLLALSEQIAKSPPQTDNVLILATDKIDKRLKANKSVLKLASLSEFAEIKSWNVQKELRPWIEQRVRSEGKHISRGAVDLLISDCGSNKFILQQSIEKILVYLGADPEINEGIVKKLVMQTESDIFLLLDLLAERKAGEAYIQLQTLLLSDAPEKVIATLGTMITKSYRVRWYQHLGHSSDEIAQQVKLHPYVVKMDLKRWAAFTLEHLESAMNYLLELQTRTRRSRLKSGLALELWLGEFLKM